MELIETSVFTRQITALVSDEDYSIFQVSLAANPAMGRLIRGGGGIRKVRLAAGGKGKRGGARIIYYWAVQRDVIVLLLAYAKSEKADLTPRQTAELATLVKTEFGYEGGIV